MSEEKTKTPFQKLSEPLTAQDIEFRIGNASAGNGFSLLAYKTARVDTKRLNDVFGAGWTNRFYYDDKGLLCCEISIYVQDLKQWVGRTDVGTESQTEKEKGSYSDAFKRAGFKWGIGAELYDFPFMWVKWDKWEDRGGKKYPKFMAGNIKIEEYLFKDGEVKKLKLSYDGKVIFEIGRNVKIDDDKHEEAQKPLPPKELPKATILFNKLKEHYKCSNDEVKAMLAHLNITSSDTAKIESALSDFGAIIVFLDEANR